MSIRSGAAAFAGLLVAAGVVAAAPVTVTLGQSGQNFTLNGLGGDGSGNGFYQVTQGPCSFASGDTTCMFSGAFTGTTAGFTSGTYSLVTTYVGNGASPLMAITTAPGSNFFTFTSVPATATITLDLTDPSNDLSAIPIFANGNFVSGAGYNVLFVSPTCSGTPVANCSVNSVGLVAGSVITGEVTGGAGFDTTTAVITPAPPVTPVPPVPPIMPTATPEPRWLGLTGLLFGAVWLARKKFALRQA